MVGRGRRALLAVTAVATGLAGAALVAALLVQAPEVRRADDGALAARDAHTATLLQQSGLRGYLLTGQDRALDSYRRGRDDVDVAQAAAERAAAASGRQRARLAVSGRLRRSWVEGWALEALARPEATAAFARQGEALFEPYRAAAQAAVAGADALAGQAHARQVRLLVSLLVVQLTGAAAAVLVLTAGPGGRHVAGVGANPGGRGGAGRSAPGAGSGAALGPGGRAGAGGDRSGRLVGP